MSRGAARASSSCCTPTNDPFKGAPCSRETCIPCCNSDEEREEDCDKRGILHETFCTTYRDLAKDKRARARRRASTCTSGKPTWSWPTGAPSPWRRRQGGGWRAGLMEATWLGRHTLEMYPGEQQRFGITILRTYTSAFNLVIGEVIRIFYRSREENVGTLHCTPCLLTDLKSSIHQKSIQILPCMSLQFKISIQ